MAINVIVPEIIFPHGFDDRAEAEMTDKGHLSGVVVRFDDGSQFPVNFIDPCRLAQDLGSDTEAGTPYFAEPGLVVVPQVTMGSIQRAVDGLAREGFFETQKALDAGRLGGDPGEVQGPSK